MSVYEIKYTIFFKLKKLKLFKATTSCLLEQDKVSWHFELKSIPCFFQLHFVGRHLPLQLHLLNVWLPVNDNFLAHSSRTSLVERKFLDHWETASSNRPTFEPILWCLFHKTRHQHPPAEWPLECSWSRPSPVDIRNSYFHGISNLVLWKFCLRNIFHRFGQFS